LIILNGDLREKVEKYLETKGKDIKIQKGPGLMSGETVCPNNVIKTKKELQKLTEEQKQKILYVFHDFSSKYFSDENPDAEYITEYDILMKQKEEEFKNYLLEENEASQIEALLEMCDKYIKEMEIGEEPFSAFGFIIMYDMWLNKSPIWPVPFNPEWEKWNKLKDKKIKRKEAAPYPFQEP
jgi:hypothetical protein